MRDHSILRLPVVAGYICLIIFISFGCEEGKHPNSVITFEKQMMHDVSKVIKLRPLEDGEFLLLVKNGIYPTVNFQLIKFDRLGDTLWTRQLPKFGYGWYSELFVKADGDLLLMGTFDFEIHLVTMDKNGLFTAKKVIEASLYSAIPLKNGNYLLCASMDSTSDCLIMQITASGDTIATSQISLFDDYYEEEPRRVYQISDGSFVVGGQGFPYAADGPWFYMRLDASLHPIWTKKQNLAGGPLGRVQTIFESDHKIAVFIEVLLPVSMSGITWMGMDGDSLGYTDLKSYSWIPNTNMLKTSSDDLIAAGRENIARIRYDGSAIWSRQIPATISDLMEHDGGFVFAGNVRTSGDSSYIYILKTNQDGE